jgi:hypothetical protein
LDLRVLKRNVPDKGAVERENNSEHRARSAPGKCFAGPRTGRHAGACDRREQAGRVFMQQVKIFKGLESEVVVLEKQVNAWLAESGVRVLQITGNIAPQGVTTDPKAGSIAASPYAASDILLIVLYEKL